MPSLLALLMLCFAPLARAQQRADEPANTAAAAVAPASHEEPASADVPREGSEYVVGAADVLDITVWKEPELSRTAIVVRPDGMISLPLIGVQKVSGMTPSQIQDLLAEKLHRYLAIAQVTVTVTGIKSKFVYVTGEVNHPGVFELLSPTDLLQIVIRAGGLTPFARGKSVLILRIVDGKSQKIEINYRKLVRGESPEMNLRLLPGDTVVVR